jgi:hypothetical protein
MSDVESRARWLLRFYPAAYREDRAEEILGTLLEASPEGRHWPPFRDARSLLIGGMRARSAENRRLPLGTNLRLALILGLAIFLALHPATLMTVQPFWPGAAYEACGLLMIATIVATWFAPRAVTIAIALVTAVALGLLARHMDGRNLAGVASFILAPVALAAAVATEPVRPPRSWLWLPAAAGVSSILVYLQNAVVDLSARLSSIAGSAAAVIYLGLLAAIFVWLVTDARPLLALVIALGLAIEPDVAFGALRYGASGPQAIVALVPVVLAALALLRMRRKAVVAAPR